MYAVIYDHGPEEDPVEEYYEAFETPERAREMFRAAYPKDNPDIRNARLVRIICPIDDI